jgi:hypothetical protein
VIEAAALQVFLDAEQGGKTFRCDGRRVQALLHDWTPLVNAMTPAAIL